MSVTLSGERGTGIGLDSEPPCCCFSRRHWEGGNRERAATTAVGSRDSFLA
jgi:hypothetical protein